ncbi:MAG: RNase adapter RapZ [Lachnospiraceae bacterium]
MRLVIVTGMSGAGKSTTLKMLEDAGYFCVDNLPIALVPKFIEMFEEQDNEVEHIAVGIDSRSGERLSQLAKILDRMDQKKLNYEILFLESSDDVLVKRYKESRRIHPLSGDARVDTGIAEERQQVAFLKKKANYIIDTSRMLTRELQAEINHIFVSNKGFSNLRIAILSFGFKYGIPNDADLVFDVRFLPNPYYLDELRPLSGNDQAVRDFVMENEKAYEFLWKLNDMVKFLLPNYIIEGKHQLVIAIGCTGGKHRSVTLANELYQSLNQEEIYSLSIEHRDIEKDSRQKGK